MQEIDVAVAAFRKRTYRTRRNRETGPNLGYLAQGSRGSKAGCSLRSECAIGETIERMTGLRTDIDLVSERLLASGLAVPAFYMAAASSSVEEAVRGMARAAMREGWAREVRDPSDPRVPNNWC